jgi:hypothetical protein
MSGYTKLFGDIVDSSIWREPPEYFKVWIALLVLCDPDGFVRGSIGWLSMKTGIPDLMCADAIKKFSEPEKESRTSDHEGRRIEILSDGFLVLNYLKYRDMLSTNPTAVATRERVRLHRERYKALRNVTTVTPAPPADADEDADASDSDSEGESKGEPAKPTAFDVFWKAYPRKVGKLAAKKAWAEADKPPLKAILDAILAQLQGEQWRKDHGQYIPHPATWLNQGRWDDVVPGAQAPVDPSERQRQRTQADTAALNAYADELLAIRAEEQQPGLTDERRAYITDCASRLFKKIKDNFGVEGIGKVKLIVLERNKT